MYENIGSKIKKLAMVLLVLETIILEISGFYYFISGSFSFDIVSGVIGIAAIVLGPVIAWISTLTLYGFGELVENSSDICETVWQIKSKLYLSKREAETRKEKNTPDAQEDDFVLGVEGYEGD